MLKKLKVNHYLDIGMLALLALFPLLASPFRVEMMGVVVSLMMFAISLDLIWGYGGLLSMGHAVFFGMGAYVAALSGAFREGVPTFMVKAGQQTIPLLMRPLQNPVLAVALGLILPGVLAAILGVFLFSGKVNGVYFTLITLAFSSIVATLVNNQQRYTSGFNGIRNVSRPFVFGEKLKLIPYYYLAVLLLIGVYFLCRFLTATRFGKIVTSVRDNEFRTRFLGYSPQYFKIIVYIISAMMAGLAGMLYAPFNSFVSPTDVGVVLSTNVIIWVAIGGRGNITGALFGTLMVNWSEKILSEYLTGYWHLILGVVIVLVVLYMPSGLVGTLIERQYERTVARQQAQSGAPTQK